MDNSYYMTNLNTIMRCFMSIINEKNKKTASYRQSNHMHTLSHWNTSMNNHYKTSLRKQTMYIFIAMLCLLVFMFLLSSFLISRKANDDFRFRTSETALRNVDSTIASSIDTYNYISRLIMVNDRVVSFLHAKEANKSISYEARMGIYEILSMLNHNSQIESVYIFRNDFEYAYSGTGKYTIHFDSPQWNQILSARGSKVISVNSNHLMEKEEQKPFLTLARAIYDVNSQKHLGYLVMNISSHHFDEVLNLQKSCSLCVMNEDGLFLCGNRELTDLFDRRTCSNTIVSKITKLHGRRSVLSCLQTKDSLVILCSTSFRGNAVPMSTVLELIILFITLFVSVILYAGFIRTRITKPLEALDYAIEQTKSAGWLKPINHPMPSNEIGRLADNYNSMIDYLNKLFDEILMKEEATRKAELRVLHEQIKPHFLYNTLGTISYLAIEEQAEKTHDALETLGSFFRNFLSNGDREIPLDKELRITEDYLSLQKLRYGSSFEDEFIIDDNARKIKVPKLILQPLVENSIYHGIKPKGEFCQIRITAKVMNEELHLFVYDNGIGMTEKKIREITSQRLSLVENCDNHNQNGFGLPQTIERIRYYCNRSDIVRIQSEEGEYTEIELIIPLRIENPIVSARNPIDSLD